MNMDKNNNGKNDLVEGAGNFAKEVKDDAVRAAKNEVKYTVRSAVRKGLRSVINSIIK